MPRSCESQPHKASLHPVSAKGVEVARASDAGVVRPGGRRRRRSRAAHRRPSSSSLAAGPRTVLRPRRPDRRRAQRARGGAHGVRRVPRGVSRPTGPTYLACTGETEFVAGEAMRDPNRLIGGIVGHADLTDGEHLDEVLDAHADARAGPVPRHPSRRSARPASRGAHHPRPGTGGALRRSGVPRRRRAPRRARAHVRHVALPPPEPRLRRARPSGARHDDGARPLRHTIRRRRVRRPARGDLRRLARRASRRSQAATTCSPSSAAWRCPTTGSAGIRPPGRPPPTSSLRSSDRTTCTRSSAFGPERCMFESNFPVDQYVAVVPGVVERPQEDRGAVLRRRTGRDVLRHGDPRVPHHDLIGAFTRSGSCRIWSCRRPPDRDAGSVQSTISLVCNTGAIDV